MMVMTTDFKIEFGGESHDLEINTLLTSLLNFTGVIQEIKDQFAPEAKVDIRVRPPERGSFLLDMVLSAPDSVNYGLSLFTRGNISLADNIVAIFANMIGLKQHLQGELPNSVIEGDNGMVFIENHSGVTVELQQPVYQFYASTPKVDALLSKAFQAISHDTVVESLRVTKDRRILADVQADMFKIMGTAGTIGEPPSRRDIVKQEVFVRAFRFSFEDFGRWWFVYEGNTICASIADQAFIQAIEDNEPFAKGDRLRVDISILQEYDKSVQDYLNKQFTIMKVHEHIRAPRQGKMF